MSLIEHNGTAKLQESSETKDIKAQTLDDIVSQNWSDRSIDIIKIDTDGFDFDVIDGAKSVLKRYTPWLLFEFDCSFRTDNIDACISSLGFLRSIGYKSALIYSNRGFLIMECDLCNPDSIRDILTFQNLFREIYFDILLPNPSSHSSFATSERQYFRGL